jgi:hypothetical protein
VVVRPAVGCGPVKRRGGAAAAAGATDGRGKGGVRKKKWRERDLTPAADPTAAAARDEEGEPGRGETTAEKLTGFEKRGCWRRRRGSSLGERGSTAHQVRRRDEDWLSRLSEEEDDSVLFILEKRSGPPEALRYIQVRKNRGLLRQKITEKKAQKSHKRVNRRAQPRGILTFAERFSEHNLNTTGALQHPYHSR